MITFKKIQKFLNQPYPFYFEGKAAFYIFVLLYLMTLAFNMFFEPFNVYTPEHRMSYFWISMVHAAVAGMAFIFLCLVTGLFPGSRSNWTVGKEVAWLGGFLLLAGIGQFLIRDFIYDNPANWTWHYFIEEVRNTILVGLLFIAILVPLNFNRLYQRNQKMARQLYTGLTGVPQQHTLEITTKLKSDDFELNTADFILARSDGNYVDILMYEDGSVRKTLKRITIRSLEKQLYEMDNIMRTHRSYLVNLSKIEKITGNAQGYKLKLRDTGEAAYVSRGLIAKFDLRLKK